MKNNIEYTLVGLFVLGLGTALIAGVLWLGSGGPGRSYEVYTVYMTESVAGLSRDGAVKYRGVDVGRIREIGLDPDNLERVKLLLEIEDGTPIREDTVATLEVQGLTGLGYINLVGGSQAAAPLTAKPGEDYPVIPSRPSVWGRLDRSIGELVDNLIEASERINTLLSTGNQERLSQTLANLQQLTGSLAGRSDKVGQALDDLAKLTGTLAGRTGSIDRSLDDLAKTLHNTRTATAHLPDLVEQLQQSAKSLEHMADEIGETGSAIRQTVAARDRDLQRFTSTALPEATSMMQELREAAGNLRRLSESLERDPSVLVYGPPAPAPGPGE
jgi:phospholipid/cholesterol/gamma-HCH transport system substrate-binding protein